MGIIYIYILPSNPERLASALGALLRSYTSPMIFLVMALSASGNLPLLISCVAMALAVLGHGVVLEAWPVSLLMVCHARRLECVKSIDSTVSVYHSLRLVLSRVMRSVAALALSALLFASLWTRRKSSHSSSLQGT